MGATRNLDVSVALGERLRRIRVRERLPQRGVVALLSVYGTGGYCQAQISDIEAASSGSRRNNRYQSPRRLCVDELVHLCRVYGVDPATLLTEVLIELSERPAPTDMTDNQ